MSRIRIIIIIAEVNLEILKFAAIRKPFATRAKINFQSLF
jgi:hypothetical protein